MTTPVAPIARDENPGGLEGRLAELGALLAEREPTVQALVPEPERLQRLRTEAARLGTPSSEDEPRLPLTGWLVAVKDIFQVEGLPTRAGSALPDELLRGSEAAVVALLRRAGALILGKAHTTEFAYFGPGPTRNPVDPERTPGGSSSGSAAAVAAGYCDGALGTQTIGSVCRPASYCGVVGFKPSSGRVSAAGVIPLSPSLDHVGWFTRDVAATEALAGVLCAGWSPEGRSRLRLGIPAGPYWDHASGNARSRVERGLAQLRVAEFELVPTPLFEDFDEVRLRHYRLVAGEAARVHESWFDRFEGDYHPKTAELIREGQSIPDEQLEDDRQACLEFRRKLERVREEAELSGWVSPAAPDVAPVGLDSTGDPVMNLPWTQAGLPSISVPLSTETGELPLGLQLIGGFRRDEDLLATARQVEAVLAESAA